MIYYYLVTTLLTFISLIILIFSFEVKKVNYYFMVMTILLAIANGGYLAIALSDNMREAILGNKICYLGGCFVPVVTLMLLCTICNYNVPTWMRVGLYSYSFIVYAMVLTIGYSDIYYKEAHLEEYRGVTVLAHTYGAGHKFFYVIMYGYMVAQIGVVLYSVFKKKAVSKKNIWVAASMVVVTILVYAVGRQVNRAIEVVPVAYVIDSWIILYMYRGGIMYNIEDNIATSFGKQENSGYVMFDKKKRYLGSNDYAKKIFPDLIECVIDRPMKCTEETEKIVQWLQCFEDGEIEEFSYKSGEKHYEGQIVRMWYRKKNYGYMIRLTEDTDKWMYVNLLAEHNRELEGFQAKLEQKVSEQTEELQMQQNKINKLFVQTVMALSDAVDAKDRYTSGHSKRVAKYARLIAERMGKNKEEQEEIYRAGLLHDVGKIRIPAEIINKPGKLTDEEYDIIKIHPATGYHILRGISENSYIAVGAKYHHERYDGKGYPNGLAGEKIPEVARILGVADAYDAMASNRSYRNALPQEVVRAEIEKGKGTQFDPFIADVMLRMIDDDIEYTMKQTESMGRRILTVDDEVMNNKIIAHIMKDEPMYEVVSVTSGMAAIEVLEDQRFDLIMLDVKMPEMDGLETLKRIRRKFDTPVVLMTSDKNLDTSGAFAQLGCDDYITKPFLPLLIKEVVHNMTERTNMGN